MRAPLLLLALSACAYDAPLDPYADPVAATITGTVVADADEAANAVVLVFDAADPGPPAGTGRPVTFTAVGARDFTPEGADGLLSGPFTVTDVPMGGADERTFLVNALLDADGDFNPLFGGLAGATCGDVGGAYLTDLTTLAQAEVTVRAGQRMSGISVLTASPVTTERPAFTVAAPTLSKDKAAHSAAEDGSPLPAALQLYRLTATAVHTDYAAGLAAATRDPAGKQPFPLDLDGPCAVADEAACSTNVVACGCDVAQSDPCDTAFQVMLVDDDGDGEVDPYPAEIQAANGLHDIWPRIFLVYAGAPLGDAGAITGYSEIDLDPGNNVLAPATEGYPYVERWVAESFPFALETAFGIPAELPVGVNIPMRDLDVLFSPVFRHYWSGGADGADASGSYDLIDLRCTAAGAPFPWCHGATDPGVVPEGAWQITVVERTAQTWSVPNEIAWLDLPSTGEGFDPAAQGVGLVLGP